MTSSKGETTRAAIVDCAKQLFYEHGYDGTSFTDIVQASGLVRGNINHYFKTKDDILKAVIQQHLDEFTHLLTHWDKKYTEPKARLLAFVDMVTGRKAELVQYGCPIGSLNTELGKDRQDLQLYARALFNLFRDWLSDQFRVLNYGDQSQGIALHLLGRAQGIAVIAHVYRDAKLLRSETELLKEWISAL